jgi:hypothetical protein
MGRETLHTGGNILSDIAGNKPPNAFGARNTASKRLN